MWPYHGALTAGGSSRCSGSSSPSSCPVCTGSRAREWLAAPSWRSRTGFVLPGPASHCRRRPHTAARCAAVDCSCRRPSKYHQPAGSPGCRHQKVPQGGILWEEARGWIRSTDVGAERRQNHIKDIKATTTTTAVVTVSAGLTTREQIVCQNVVWRIFQRRKQQEMMMNPCIKPW